MRTGRTHRTQARFGISTLLRMAAVSAAAMSFLGAAADPASALIREGTGKDASGDSAGGANRDIVEASFRYDTNGQVTVSGTMAAPIDPANADAFIAFSVATAGADGSCSGATISIFGFFSSSEGSVTVTGLSGVGSATKVINGASIAFVFSDSKIANRDYTCTTAVVTNRSNTTPEFTDNVVPDVFAAGFGPDRDGDGKTDNVDACPDQAGPNQANGCPPDTTGPIINLPSANRSITATSSGIVRFKVGPTVEDTTGVLLLKTAGKVKTASGKRKVIALGSKSFKALKGQTASVGITLSKANRKLLRKLKRFRGQANITLRDTSGNATIKTYTFTIKSPR